MSRGPVRKVRQARPPWWLSGDALERGRCLECRELRPCGCGTAESRAARETAAERAFERALGLDRAEGD